MAPRFDERFGQWKSVAAQRTAVRRELIARFPPDSSLLELGGGTGEDALFLAANGRRIHLTDGSPSMVACAREKVRRGAQEGAVTLERVGLEELGELADRREAAQEPRFAGCYSNFAAFNCVEDLGTPAKALSRLVAPGGAAILVLFGAFSPGEVVTMLVRRDPKGAFRRLSRSRVPARVGAHSFTVTYHTAGEVARAFAPWFRLTRKVGIGVFVPPSSAEPWISGRPRLLSALERLDAAAARPLALLGDHVLVHLERTEIEA
jgi:SAM-dependent methyltransferase